MPQDWTSPPTLDSPAARARTLLHQQTLEKLQAIYRAGHKDETTVPRPSLFQADPLVVGGGSQLAREARRLLDLDPVTKSRAGTITYGPTTASMELLSPIDTTDGRTVLGMHDTRTHQIGLQAPVDPAATPIRDTLAHEIAHVAGRDEWGAEEAGNVAHGLQSDAESLRDIMAAKARVRASLRPKSPERMTTERVFEDAIGLERQRAEMTMRRGPNLIPRMPRR